MTYFSSSKKFKYYDDKKCPNVKSFKKPMEQEELTFDEFVQKINKGKSKGQRYGIFFPPIFFPPKYQNSLKHVK